MKEIFADAMTLENSPEKNQESDKNLHKIFPTIVEDEMKRSYLDYSMSVIVGRALPDVRDGLKPVHRRVLFTMMELGLLPSKPFKKSARVVGDCLGKYHPHGDTAVYDSLVRMAQPFSLRYPLVIGQGNFGSVDGDSAAAMRYTESKMSKIAEEMLEDIKKETIDFIPNFDNSLQEPTVLPSKVPNLLVNGSSGIAVGMATNIPPHNMAEVCNAIIHLVDNPEADASDMMKFVKGPDFPTGGIICGTAGIKQAYSIGRGKILVRGRADIEPHKNRERIIITEIPYQLNKTLLIEQIADLVNAGTISGVSDIRDESDKDGMRIVIELKQDANSNITLNQLFKRTRLESTFGIIMLSLVDGRPVVLNLKDTIQKFVDHRKEVITRRTAFDLKKAEERAHVLEGLIIALDSIDEIVQKIKQSKTAENAKTTLMQDYSLSEIQAKAILDMKLQKLSSLEQENIRKEHKDLLGLIADLKAILADERKIMDILKKETMEIKEKYGDKRMTEISEVGEEDIEIEDLIEEEDVVITVSHAGYIKRCPIDTYKQQGRGGRGIIAAGQKDDDFIENLFVSSTHSYVLFFTNKGQVYWLKVYQIPEGSRQAKGKAIVNLVQLSKDEKITAFVPVREFNADHFLFMATKKGTVKKTSLAEFSRPRRNGIRAMTMHDNDELVEVLMTDGSKDMILATRHGMAIRFNEKNVRAMGRSAAGVRGISLKKADDMVIGMVIGEDGGTTLLTITDNGYGKRTNLDDYRLIGRGGKGVINIQCSERNGKVCDISAVTEDDDVMFISQKGIIIRTPVNGISCIGRNTQGVRLMKVGSGDKVVAAAKIVKE